MARGARDRHIDGFGRWADTYDRSFLQRLLFAPVRRSILARATAIRPAPISVLDIGCGTGLLLREAAQCIPSARLTGIDAAPDMVRVALAAVPESLPVQFLHGFAERLPFADATFDLVVTTMSFHHWADQRKALGEVRRVSSCGGTFVLADLLATGPARIGLAGSHWGRFNSPAALVGMLRDAGFEVEPLARVPRVPGCVRVAFARVSGG